MTHSVRDRYGSTSDAFSGYITFVIYAGNRWITGRITKRHISMFLRNSFGFQVYGIILSPVFGAVKFVRCIDTCIHLFDLHLAGYLFISGFCGYDYISAFAPFVEQGFDVVHLTLGHGLSSSAQNCRIAAEEVGHVWVVDTCNLSTGSGLLVLETAKRIAAGMEAAQIAAEVEALIPCCHASFVLNTLEFLYKGGRCSALAMLGANVLQLKPCIEVNTADGTMSVGKKYRGAITKAREQYVRDQLSRDDLDYEKIFFTHSGLPDDQIEAILHVIRECGDFKEIFVTRAGCTISSHCGPECMGVLFMTKQ